MGSEDTAQVLSATLTQRGSASRGRSRTQGRSPDRPAIPSQGRSVSLLPMRSASLCRPRFPDRSVKPQGLTFPSMAILERIMATLLELALLLVLGMASPLVQEDMDMVIKPFLVLVFSQ